MRPKTHLHESVAMLVNAVVMSRMHCCNGLHRHQYADHSLTHAWHDSLRWLDVPERVTFNHIGTTAYKCLYGTGPTYLYEMCWPTSSETGRHYLRSADHGQLVWVTCPQSDCITTDTFQLQKLTYVADCKFVPRACCHQATVFGCNAGAGDCLSRLNSDAVYAGVHCTDRQWMTRPPTGPTTHSLHHNCHHSYW